MSNKHNFTNNKNKKLGNLIKKSKRLSDNVMIWVMIICSSARIFFRSWPKAKNNM